MIKFNEAGKSSIVWCVLDTLDKADGPLPKDVSINTIDFIIYSLINQGYDIFVGSSEKELLTTVSTENYTHAVIVSTGTHLGTNFRLFSEVDKLCSTDFFIAGHILDRGDDYLELHQQFYVINLKDYQEFNCPEIIEGSWMHEDLHTEIEPIIEYQPNSDYVIKSVTNGINERTYKKKRHGYNILALALKNNKTIIDLGQNIRSSKYFLYPDLQHVFYKEFSKIFQLQLVAKNVVSIWNTDNIHDTLPFDGPVEQYITVGTGLNWIKNLMLLEFTEHTTIVFTDINYNCLCFMQQLVSEWDGVDYDKFYKDYKQLFPNGVPEEVFKNLSASSVFEEFKAQFDNWPKVWQTVKQLKFDFILIDYFGTYDLSFIKQNKKTVINFSDLFNHHTSIPFQSVKFRVSTENKLLDSLNKINPDMTVILFTRSASNYIEYTDAYRTSSGVFVDKVKNFKPTNIGMLKKLPWHTTDWAEFKVAR